MSGFRTIHVFTQPRSQISPLTTVQQDKQQVGLQ